MVVITSLLLTLGAALAQEPPAPESMPAPVEIEEEAVTDAEERKMTLLEAAAAGLDAISNLEAKFTQVAPSGNVSTGTLFLSRPGRLRFEYDEPNPQLIVATGGLVYVHDAELETTDSYPVGQTPLRFLLASELDLNSAEVLAVEENRHGLRIDLAAKDKDLQGQLSLFFHMEPIILSGWSFHDPRGNLTVISLEDVEERRRLPQKLFKIPEADGAFLRDR
ncbi:MAG: outer membrane lipoprotein carrier protein LolA [Pseudomonadota bacterium]